ncbi:MAG: PQQ-binding-like beta-propeller repeat protein [Armatimonadetes bacterium]|nr:PQQ-binding-like beta-propeller repeat protein [Armatimonadota bacterium]
MASDSGRQRWRAYLESDLAFAPPVVRREKVYVAVGKKVFAVDAANGNRRWDFAVPAFITGPIAATDDAVFVGTREGAVYCLDAATGRAKWRYPKEGVSQPVQTGVCVCGDSVVTRAGTRSVLTLDAKTGRLIWQYDLPEGPMRLPRSRALALGGRGQLGGGAPEGGAVPGGGPAGPGAGMPGMPGRLGQGLTWTAAEIEMEDVLEAPLAPADNRIYIVGDDCVLYGLEADAPDNVPPRITQAVLEIQGANKVMFAYSVPIDDIEQFPLRLADLVKVPGAPPVYLSVSVVDLGCGVDPDSLSMTMDGKKLDITYEAEKGILWFIYDPKGRGAAPLPNGKHNVVIEAADWRGNRAQVQLSFTVDNSMSPPSVATGARPGFGGPEGPGMMGPGGPAGPGGMMGPGGPGGMMMPPGPMP